MSRNLTITPPELWPTLEAAALRYAEMSPSDFKVDTLRVGVTRLRDLGMIDGDTWAKVPALVDVVVKRKADGGVSARVILPPQA